MTDADRKGSRQMGLHRTKMGGGVSNSEHTPPFWVLGGLSGPLSRRWVWALLEPGSPPRPALHSLLVVGPFLSPPSWCLVQLPPGTILVWGCLAAGGLAEQPPRLSLATGQAGGGGRKCPHLWN